MDKYELQEMNVFKSLSYIKYPVHEKAIHIFVFAHYYLIILTEQRSIYDIDLNLVMTTLPLLLLQVGFFYIILLIILPRYSEKRAQMIMYSSLHCLVFLSFYMLYVINAEALFDEVYASSHYLALRSILMKIFVLHIIGLAVFYHKEHVKDITKEAGKQIDNSEMDAEIVRHELNALKSQFNAHLTFNTLNLLYARVIDNESLARPIMFLSSYLKYNVRPNAGKKVSLSTEIEHIKDYLSLCDLIHPGIQYRIEVNGQDTESLYIIPRILINYVENAIKHGAIGNKESPVDISLFAGEQIYFKVKNMKRNRLSKHGNGFGLFSTIKMLDLFYGENYQLNIKEDDLHFEVCLTVPALYDQVKDKSSLTDVYKNL
jgi:two-component system, LytTR family, sensor kinase